jgi:hypothetical protein
MTRTLGGMINFWNQSAEKLYGWRKEEAIGRVSHNLLQTQFPKTLEEIDSELVRTGRWEGKLVHTTRDGSRVVVESHWILESESQPGPVVEINTPSTDDEMDLQVRAGILSVSTDREEPVSASRMRADDFSPKIASVILAVGAFLCIFVFTYFVYYYGWKAERHLSHPFATGLYLVFPVALAGLLFAFLWSSPEVKVKIAAVCVSVAASVWLLELVLALFTLWPLRSEATLWGPADLKGRDKEEIVALAKESGIDFDHRRKVEVVMDLRKQGISAVPNIVPLDLLHEQQGGALKSAINIGGAEVLPVGGISNRVAVVCNESGQFTIHKSDEHGFHNPRGIWQSARIGIAAVGDSFAEGSCVAPDRNFVTLLRERYPATLNLGKSGNGPMITLAALEEYLSLKQPEVVLWFHFEGNEFQDLLDERKSPLLRNYLRDGFSQRLIVRQNEIDEALTEYVEAALKKELAVNNRGEKESRPVIETAVAFLKLRQFRQSLAIAYERLARTSGDDTYSNTQLDLFRSVLKRAQESVDRWGGKLYFVYLPARDRYANGQEYSRQSVRKIVSDLGLVIIDLEPAFRLQRNPLSLFPYGRFGHYNEDGHRLVADEVLRILNQRALRTSSTTLPTGPHGESQMGFGGNRRVDRSRARVYWIS